jgi:ribose 1,5-bisphosphokinase PhnN
MKPLIVVGPSGVGKKTLLSHVLKKYGELFSMAQCFTTNEATYLENPLVYQHVPSFDGIAEEDLIDMHTRADGFNYGITYSNVEKVKE